MQSHRTFDAYGGWTHIKGEKTGVFHIETIGRRPWFITPEGHAFFPVSLDHLLSGDSKFACEQIYGGDRVAWIRDSVAKYRALGFNCALAGAGSPERNLNNFVDIYEAEQIFREEHLPYAAGLFAVKHPWEFEEGEILPDIFELSFTRQIEAKAKTVCSQHRDDPWMLGYYYGFGSFIRSQQWINQILAREEGSPGRTTLINSLEQRYKGNTAAFNMVYGTELKQIADLKTTKTLSYDRRFETRYLSPTKDALDPRQVNDFEALVQIVAIKLYTITNAAIRQWDTRHLILGPYLKEWSFAPETWKAIAPYMDVIAPQHMNREINNSALVAAAGKPAILSDDEFGFYYKTGRGYQAVRSHEDRATIYAQSLNRHLHDPAVAGVSYCCTIFDQMGASAEGGNQHGFYDAQGRERTHLITVVKEANGKIYDRATNPASPRILKNLNLNLFNTWDACRVR